jgi:hypothetical protein
LTADEWNTSHPAQAQAYLDAWLEKQKRTENRLGSLLLTVAKWSGNVRNGVTLKLADFVPKWAARQVKPEDREALLKAKLQARVIK